MVDSCPTHLSEEEIYAMLMDNFNRHYKTNRAPFGLYFHTIWFKEKQNFDVLLRFLDDLIGNKVLIYSISLVIITIYGFLFYKLIGRLVCN